MVDKSQPPPFLVRRWTHTKVLVLILGGEMIPRDGRGDVLREVRRQRISFGSASPHEDFGSFLRVSWLFLAALPSAVPDVKMRNAVRFPVWAACSVVSGAPVAVPCFWIEHAGLGTDWNIIPVRYAVTLSGLCHVVGECGSRRPTNTKVELRIKCNNHS